MKIQTIFQTIFKQF